MNKVKSTAAKSVQKQSTSQSKSYGTATALVEGCLTVIELPLSHKTRQILSKDACKNYHVDFETFVMLVNIDKTGLTLMLHTKPCSLELDALLSNPWQPKKAADIDASNASAATKSCLSRSSKKQIVKSQATKLTGISKKTPKTSKKPRPPSGPQPK
jgi:hypothetical protein